MLRQGTELRQGTGVRQGTGLRQVAGHPRGVRRSAPLLLLGAVLALSACHRQTDDANRPVEARGFPRADRPVSAPSRDDGATEAARDHVGEAASIMDLAGIRPGMTVADIGAGGGYYTVRLAPRVGRKGRVLAEDIDREALARLGDRVQREALDNVSITLGDEADPRLPPASFDRVFLVHMYHEVSEPYAFLWHLRPALKPGGTVVVVDADKPTGAHGMPPALLFCEFSSLGFRLTDFARKPQLTGYFAQFEAAGARPTPDAIRPCHDTSRSGGHVG